MANKIFISYKYSDNNVKNISGSIYESDTVRTYVNKIEDLISKDDHIFKAEKDGEDLSNKSDEWIWETLKDRIYDSSVTIVMISPNMKELWRDDKDQWIPQEISYSLKETTRKDKTSRTNAVLLVVVPDRNGSYNYFVETKNCCNSSCNSLNFNNTFSIVKNNMLNIKTPDKRTCDSGSTIYSGYSSYFYYVRWEDFIQDINSYIDIANNIKENKSDYNIVKSI